MQGLFVWTLVRNRGARVRAVLARVRRPAQAG